MIRSRRLRSWLRWFAESKRFALALRHRLRRYAICLAASTILIASLSPSASAQSTKITLYALWDDGRPVHAKIDLHQTVTVGATTSDVVAASTNTTGADGKAEMTYTFSQVATYYWQITCQAFFGSTQLAACPDGKVLAEYPLWFLFMKPANVPSAQANLVYRKSDRTLAKADLAVHLSF